MNKEHIRLEEKSFVNIENSGSLKSSLRSYVKEWQICGYVITNAISSGAFLVLFTGLFLNHFLEQPFMSVRPSAIYSATCISLVFLIFTALLLSTDIKNYKRYIYGLSHPDKGSRFVMGTYSILIFGILVTLLALVVWYKNETLSILLIYTTAAAAILLSLSTAHLVLGKSKKNESWNLLGLSLHMLVHSFMAGGAAFSIANAFFTVGSTWVFFVDMILHTAITFNLFTHILAGVLNNNSYQKRLVKEMISGDFKSLYWVGNILLGNVLPFVLIFFSDIPILQTIAGILILMGIFITDKIWIATPKIIKVKKIEVINN
ncbi:MAG: hypothetical protein ACI85Q_002296 [Salibacteraceae bacterium]|jgi:hypothetical protein